MQLCSAETSVQSQDTKKQVLLPLCPLEEAFMFLQVASILSPGVLLASRLPTVR